MAIWPFNRTKNPSSDVPPEVQNYYQAEKREKVGIAGLLALGTLLVTIVVAMGLFFGGRWVYRSLSNNDNKDGKQTAQQGTNDNQNTNDGDKAADTPVSTPSQPEKKPTPAPAPAPAPAETSSKSTTANSDLPNTGPGDTLAMVLGTVLVSTTVFYIKRRPQDQEA